MGVKALDTYRVTLEQVRVPASARLGGDGADLTPLLDAMRVASAQPGSVLGFNPLYLHAGAGLGKSHLLNAVAHRIRATGNGRRVLVLTAERFMYGFIQAVRNRDTLAFKVERLDAQPLSALCHHGQRGGSSFAGSIGLPNLRISKCSCTRSASVEPISAIL